MTTTAWITTRTPKHSDADSTDEVEVNTHIDNDNYALMHWSRAAQGYLPWRHTSQWVPPEPEPLAPVIVTPEEEPEAAAPWFGDLITDRTPTEADGDRDGDVRALYINKSEDISLVHWSTVQAGTPWNHTSFWEGDSPASAPEPTPAAPEQEPEPEKVTRGFLEFVRLPYSAGFLDSAVGTDNTAWVRYRVGNSDDNIWIKVLPLPQPGEE